MSDDLLVFKASGIKSIHMSGSDSLTKPDPLKDAAMMEAIRSLGMGKIPAYGGFVGSVGYSYYTYYYDASGKRHELTKHQLKSNVQYVVSIYNPSTRECIDSFFTDESEALKCYAQEYPADAVTKYIDLNKDTGEQSNYQPSEGISSDVIDLRPIDGKMRKVFRTLSAIPAGAAVYVTDAGIVELAAPDEKVEISTIYSPTEKRIVKEYLSRESDYTKNREQRRAKTTDEKPYWAKYNEKYKKHF